MKTSILIVSKDRKNELDKTLSILEKIVDFSETEILVFLDNCADSSESLESIYKNVNWYISKDSLGASAARNKLYRFAKGEFLIGLDDDAHPLNSDFIAKTVHIFQENKNTAIIAFEEVRGIFNTDIEALNKSSSAVNEYLSGSFVGSGFAIKRDCYFKTEGFPTWVDIYGEESCVAIQILDLGYDILFSNKIKVNHRVNHQERISQGRNYFRFEKQLKNETFYYIVFYPRPLKKIMKLYWHNFKKYAFKDLNYFILYFLTLYKVILQLSKVLKFRNPVGKNTIKKREQLQ